MQCLAEDRWEDYEWRYDKERFTYWNKGFSWIERPEMDQIGLQVQASKETMTTLPASTSDLAYYICKATNLSRSEMGLNAENSTDMFGDAKPGPDNELEEYDNLPRDNDIAASADRFCITVPV